MPLSKIKYLGSFSAVKFLLPVLFLQFLFISQLFSQTKPLGDHEKEYAKHIETADKYFENDDYYLAAQEYYRASKLREKGCIF